MIPTIPRRGRLASPIRTPAKGGPLAAEARKTRTPSSTMLGFPSASASEGMGHKSESKSARPESVLARQAHHVPRPLPLNAVVFRRGAVLPARRGPTAPGRGMARHERAVAPLGPTSCPSRRRCWSWSLPGPIPSAPGNSPQGTCPARRHSTRGRSPKRNWSCCRTTACPAPGRRATRH